MSETRSLDSVSCVSEVQRLAKLACYQILDTAPEDAFDSITTMASCIFEVPVALISLVDAERFWFKSRVGLDTPELPRKIAFCEHTLRWGKVLVVSNTTQDERFSTNPLVVDEPKVRFYAGVPLVTPDGFTLGTLCLIDFYPRTLNPKQTKLLEHLGQQVVTQLELRQKIKALTLETDLRQQFETENAMLVALKQDLELQVQRRTAELEAANASLEEKVKERTSELSTSLQHLQETQTRLLDREEHLRYTAYHDPLTGLPNRRFFLEQLQVALQLSQQKSDYQFAVLFVDLDNFKIVNDSLGHLVGDQLLKEVVVRLQRLTTEGTCLWARLSGDEFVLLQACISSLDSVTTLAQQILEQLGLPFRLKNRDISVGASIGIAQGHRSYAQPEEVLRDADIAMYLAKRKGKHRFEVFNAAMQAQAVERLDLEESLRHALGRKELQLFYQPIFSLDTGKVSGFEALLRWLHPQQGWVCPSRFIQVAEELRLIQDIGIWALQTACAQLKEWQTWGGDAAHWTINVNVSAQQLKQAEFVDAVQKTLLYTGLKGSDLKLEITESSLLEASIQTIELLDQLKRLKIQLCVDDFGTGYSSLSRLHELPIDILKIDRAFINQLANQRQGKAMVHTIMSLANSFDMQVVAEGIETSWQLKTLQRLGCPLGQGYLFAKPMTCDEVMELVHLASTKHSSLQTFHRLRKRTQA